MGVDNIVWIDSINGINGAGRTDFTHTSGKTFCIFFVSSAITVIIAIAASTSSTTCQIETNTVMAVLQFDQCPRDEAREPHPRVTSMCETIE